ncbi:MAG: PAS domain S-box protein [Candidatus Riflebacteria bacterium]|nr:PAS domain S-box protein [Candidatus Riflebacteria bacterium]
MRPREKLTKELVDLPQQSQMTSKERKTLPLPEPGSLSEEIQELLYNLQMHEIELEMQNEELRWTQMELKAVNRRYLDLYDRAPVAYFTLSEDGRILELNLPASTLLGMPKSELIKQSLTQFISQEDLGLFFSFHKQLLETGKQQTCELRLKKVDGPFVWVSLIAILKTIGDENSISMTLIDISESKRSDEAKKESDDRFHAIFEQAAIGVALVNSETGQFLRINQTFCDFVGYTVQEMLQKTFMDITYREDIHKHAELIKQLNEEKKREFSFEKRYVHKSGNIIWVNLTVSPLWESGKKPKAPYHIAIVEDINDRKRVEQQLKDLNESLEQRVIDRTEEAKRLTERLRCLACDLVKTEQSERKRLATFLHDHIQQLLVSAQMQLNLIKFGNSQTIQSAIQEIDNVLREAITASRSLTMELYPPVLHQSGLMAAFSWLAERYEKRYQFMLHIHENKPVEPSNSEIRGFLFGAARELIMNSVKHSGTKEAELSVLATNNNSLQIIVEDKGRGFVPKLDTASSDNGFGLFCIQQRLLSFGGTLEIESTLGLGTKIILTIPLFESAK